MATLDDFLTLDAMKKELRFDGDEIYFDEILGPQIAEALAWIASYTGLVLDDLAADDKRLPIIRRAAIVLVRDAFDGQGVVPKNHAVFFILGPIRSIGAVSVED